MKSEITDRIKYIDQTKCLAIFLVVWGHVIQNYGNNSNINNIIYCQIILSFHMPLFAMLSGIFFSVNNDVYSFLLKKTRQLLLPLFVWCVLLFGVLHPLCDFIRGLINGDIVNPYSIVIVNRIFYEIFFWGWWFLRALFLCFIYAYFSVKLFKGKYVVGLSFSIVVLYFLGWCGIIPNMNLSVSGFFFLYPFFCIGKIIAIYDKKIGNYLNSLLFFSFLLFVIGLYLWKGYTDSYYEMNTSLLKGTGYFGIVGVKVVERTIVRFLTGVSGSLFFILFFRKIHNMYFLSKENLLSSIGAHTLHIYLLHEVLFDFIKPRNIFQSQVIVIIACIVVSSCVVLFFLQICRLLNKSRILACLLWGKQL